MRFTNLLKFSIISLASIGMSAQTVTKLSTNQFQFVEGPVWDGSDVIYFSDIPQSKVMSYTLSTSTFAEAFGSTNRSNGLMFDENLDLLVCEGEVGVITKRRLADGAILEVLAAVYNDRRFNEPNDLCVDKKGGIYFTDPNFTFTNQRDNRLYYRNSAGEISVQETFAANDTSSPANRDKPNGVIISPDGLTLYVDNTFSKNIYKYDINQETGVLSNKTLFGELPDNSANTGADGMTVDSDGKLYVTAKQAVHIFDGTQLAPINTITGFDENATNCTFGGAAKDILFVTAGTNLYQVTDLGVTGFRHPFDLPESGTLSTLDLSLKESVDAIYPMPVVNQDFTVKLNNNLSIEEVTLYSFTGAETPILGYTVVSGKELKVTLSEVISKGTYLLNMASSKGVISKRIVIK
ncbi:SMP-30/gluconolactonase/LRE family protein [Aquimarina agarivorans]|uniref:SMP-30/gluconolactonase/LRE family protein n=1 Tax=Aquimarina agarivorans TaxID=980584 RepID=UPI000248ED93|nr:SMP-30/gluconolactonase/LRE family protein [Aquimarina agarivorans]